jgi:hypothetical protein
MHLHGFPRDLEWYREDGGIFGVGVVAFEVVWGQTIVYVFAKLFGGEVSSAPFVYVVDVCVHLFPWCLEGYRGCGRG